MHQAIFTGGRKEKNILRTRQVHSRKTPLAGTANVEGKRLLIDDVSAGNGSDGKERRNGNEMCSSADIDGWEKKGTALEGSKKRERSPNFLRRTL